MTAEGQLSFDSEHRLRSENLSWDIDVWYPCVVQYTSRSAFIPLTLEEAKAIQSYHDVSWRHIRPHLKRDEIERLKLLEKDIDLKLKEFPRGAFIRLCGRSPKDGDPFNRHAVLHKYEENLKTLINFGHKNNVQTKMMAIARTSWLKVDTGADVMSLLLTSERVYADMIDWIRYGEPEQICLRDWTDEMSMDYEFRVFICSGVITAISQYDHYAYYPHLEKQKHVIHDGIETLWKKIHPLIGVSSYIMDVAYLNPSGKFLVIEFSPFFPCTGPALFHWGRDKDVLEGRAPFEFRIKSERLIFLYF
jgi:hypothetical protein